jgi:hypothetical protein
LKTEQCKLNSYLLSSADFQLFYSIRRRKLDHGKTAACYFSNSQHSGVKEGERREFNS